MATIDYDGPDSELTGKIIGCAIEVHRHFGCGLKEEAYEIALCWELRQLDLKVERQKACPVIYKGMDLSQENERPRRIDILVEDRIVVDIQHVINETREEYLSRLRKEQPVIYRAVIEEESQTLSQNGEECIEMRASISPK